MIPFLEVLVPLSSLREMIHFLLKEVKLVTAKELLPFPLEEANSILPSFLEEAGSFLPIEDDSFFLRLRGI